MKNMISKYSFLHILHKVLASVPAAKWCVNIRTVKNKKLHCIWVILMEEVITFKSGHKKIIGKYFFHPIILF